MQNLLLPLSLAIRAASNTESTVDSFVAFSPVSYLEDCAQYEQSSLHPPVLMFMSVHNWTRPGSWKRRCMVAAAKDSSVNGVRWIEDISCFVQFVRGPEAFRARWRTVSQTGVLGRSGGLWECPALPIRGMSWTVLYLWQPLLREASARILDAFFMLSSVIVVFDGTDHESSLILNNHQYFYVWNWWGTWRHRCGVGSLV